MPKLFGVNLAGGEFGEGTLPGVHGTNYSYPSDAAEYAYYAGKGLKLIRLPFRWERVQRGFFWNLDDTEVARIRRCLDAALVTGCQIILDLHNYGRYHGLALDRSDADHLSDCWLKIARAFGTHPALCGYELMNEPHDLPGGSATWAHLAQHATSTIRQVDQDSYILVPGYSWQSATFWPENNPTLDVQAPAGTVYAAHCYFDDNHTGAYNQAYPLGQTQRGVERLAPFQTWLRERGAQGILTEYGIPATDPRWGELLDPFLAAIDADPNLVGGTYWAGGPWWGSYPLSVEPTPFGDRPQMAVLEKYAAVVPEPPPVPTEQRVTGVFPDGTTYVLSIGR